MSISDHVNLMGKTLEEAVAIVASSLPRHRSSRHSAAFSTYKTDMTIEIQPEYTRVVIEVVSTDVEGLGRLVKSRKLRLTTAEKTLTERFHLVPGTSRPPLSFPATGTAGLPQEIPNKDWVARAVFGVKVDDVSQIGLELVR